MKRIGTILVVCLFAGMLMMAIPSNVRSVAPTITMNGVTPTTGSWITWFDFFLNYTDSDDDAPDFTPLVEISGTNYTMVANDTSDTTYTDGKFYFYENNNYNNGTISFRFWVGDGTTNVTTTIQQYTIISSSIINVTSVSSYIECQDTTYADCLTAGTSTYSVFVGTQVVDVGGQLFLGGTTYRVHQNFYSFDTSVLPDGSIINYATIFIRTAVDQTTVDYNTFVYYNTNGTYYWDNVSDLQEADWIPQASVSGLVEEGIIVNSTALLSGQQTHFGLNVQSTWVSSATDTRYVTITSRYGTAPPNLESIRWTGSASLTEQNRPFMLIDYDPPSIIEITNPKDSDVIWSKIDLMAKVNIPSGKTVDEVTFYINSNWYIASYDSGSQVYKYADFQTKGLGNNYYIIQARVNFTDGEYDIDEIQIKIENQIGKGCYWEDNGNYWICPDTRFYITPNWEGIRGNYELTKAVEDTYWQMTYNYEETSSGISNSFYRPFDNATYTDNDIFQDEFHLSDFDHSNRVWINDTVSTTSTSDDVVLNNDTYMTFYEADGQNITVNSSVSMDITRKSEIFIAKDFDWEADKENPSAWFTAWTFTNNLQSVMERIHLWIPFKEEADVNTVSVLDTTTNTVLDPAKDYLLFASGVSVSFTSLASGSTQSLTIEYEVFTQTPSNTLTISINQIDIEEQPVIKNTHTYTRAFKNVHNGNDYRIVDGRLIVNWLAALPVKTSLLVEDSDGSEYDFYWDSSNQLIVQNVNFGTGDSSYKTFYFYYDIAQPETFVDYALFILPFAFIIVLIIGLVALWGIRSASAEMKKPRITAGLISIFIALLIIAYWVIRLLEFGA
jgi:hypothetical protein